MSPSPIRSPATTVYSCSNEIIVCWSKNSRSADALKQGKAEIANRNPNLDVGSPTEAASRANAIYFRDRNKSPSPTDRLFARTSAPIARAAVFFAGALATTRRIASICIGAFILGEPVCSTAAGQRALTVCQRTAAPLSEGDRGDGPHLHRDHRVKMVLPLVRPSIMSWIASRAEVIGTTAPTSGLMSLRMNSI